MEKIKGEKERVIKRSSVFAHVPSRESIAWRGTRSMLVSENERTREPRNIRTPHHFSQSEKRAVVKGVLMDNQKTK